MTERVDYNGRAEPGEVVLILEDCRPGGAAAGQVGLLEGAFEREPGDTPNPRIRLPDGSAIWGMECWWRPVDGAGSLAFERAALERFKRILLFLVSGMPHPEQLPVDAATRVGLHD